jgi:hypothetical protein
MKLMMKIDVNFGPGFRRGKKVTYFNSRNPIDKPEKVKKKTTNNLCGLNLNNLSSVPFPQFETPDPSVIQGSASSSSGSCALTAENAGMGGLIVIGDIHGSLNSLRSALEVGILDIFFFFMYFFFTILCS